MYDHQPDDLRFISVKQKGLLSQLKEALVDLIFEEALPDRPIGIHQLTRNTFQPDDEFRAYGYRSLYRGGKPFQDYRFNKLVTQSAQVRSDYS